VAITFTGVVTFLDTGKATNGPLAGDYLWSNAANLYNGLPINGASVAFTAAAVCADDLPGLTLSSLAIDNNATLTVATGHLIATGALMVAMPSRIAAFLQRQGDDIETGRGRGRGRLVAGMGLDRGDDFLAVTEFTLGREIAAGDAGVGVRRIGPAGRLEHELIHSGKIAQHKIETEHDLEQALDGGVRLIRMDLRQFRPQGQLGGNAWIVFHRAGAGQVHAHHAVHHLGQVQIVAQHLGFGHFRQLWLEPAAHGVRHQGRGLAHRVLHGLLRRLGSRLNQHHHPMIAAM
jgi:hypothetical protein